MSTTIAPYKTLGDEGHWASWLANAEAVKAAAPSEVRYYAALEVDRRRLGPYRGLLGHLGRVGGVFDTFAYDDGTEVVTTASRLVRICAGQNFGAAYAMQEGATHVLFVATDAVLPDDAVPRLLEMEWPICGLNVPTYCLDGPPVDAVDLGPAGRPIAERMAGRWSGWDVRVHMQTAALLLVERRVFSRLRWRTDPDAGMTDDPCYHADARDLLGWETLVRHDVEGSHYPVAVGPMESRHTAEQRTVAR